MPRVSVITPVFNDEQFVAEMIASVRAQTFTDWEHVLVDDGSTDRSAEVIEALQRTDARLNLVRQANSGVSVARNVGHAASCRSSEYLLFLDHDDVLEPGMLETLVGHLDAHPDVGVVYCRFGLIDSEGNRATQEWDVRYRPGLFRVGRISHDEVETPFETLLMWGGILPSNALIRRSVYDSLDAGFDPRYFSDDTDLFMRLGLVTTIHRLNKLLMWYRRHPNQMSWDSAATSDSLDHLLDEKWEGSPLSRRDRKRFERGMNLRRYGSYVPTGIDASLSHAREGHLRRSVRFFLGAIRREALYIAANFKLVHHGRNGAASPPKPARRDAVS